MNSKQKVKLNYHQWRWLKSMQVYGATTLPPLIAKPLLQNNLIKPDVKLNNYYLTDFGKEVLNRFGDFKVHFHPPHPTHGHWKYRDKMTVYVEND